MAYITLLAICSRIFMCFVFYALIAASVCSNSVSASTEKQNEDGSKKDDTTTTSTTFDPIASQAKKNAMMKVEECDKHLYNIKDHAQYYRDLLIKAYVDNERAILDKERVISDKKLLTKEKELYEEYARLLACPSNIRYSIEIFSDLYISSDTAAKQRMAVIKIKLLQEFDRKFNDLTNLMKRLTSVKLPGDNGHDESNSFKQAWEKFKQFELYESSDTKKSDLESAIVELINEQDVELAEAIWSGSQMKIWDSRKNGNLSPYDDYVLKNLSRLTTHELQNLQTTDKKVKNWFFLDKFELYYASDLMMIGNLYKTRNAISDSRYDLCMWVMYSAANVPEISRILGRLEEEWDDLTERWQRTHTYCYLQELLYNLVSRYCQNHPALNTPTDRCRPGAEDFERFLVLITIESRSPKMRLVVETSTSAVPLKTTTLISPSTSDPHVKK